MDKYKRVTYIVALGCCLQMFVTQVQSSEDEAKLLFKSLKLMLMGKEDTDTESCPCKIQFETILTQLGRHYQRPGTYANPALSCDEVAAVSPDMLPGYAWVRNAHGESKPVLIKCAARIPTPDALPGLMMIADINMNDPLQTCPAGFRQVSTENKRVCGRNNTSGGCSSVVFPTNAVNYSRVCGRLVAYQYGPQTGFNTAKYPANKIDGPYVDGVSITHGNPSARKHVWSLASTTRNSGNSDHVCPCGNPMSASTMYTHIPDFVGNNYFCDSSSATTKELNTEDPLWDGHGCSAEDMCCQFNGPPWFCRDLPEVSNEDVELRVCGDEGWEKEDSPFQVVELYVQ